MDYAAATIDPCWCRKSHGGAFQQDSNSCCSHNAIKETVVYAQGFPSMSSMFHPTTASVGSLISQMSVCPPSCQCPPGNIACSMLRLLLTSLFSRRHNRDTRRPESALQFPSPAEVDLQDTSLYPSGLADSSTRAPL